MQALKNIPIKEVVARLGLEIDKEDKAICFRCKNSKPTLSFKSKKSGKIGHEYFRCYKCGIGGTTIDLVRYYKKLSKEDAIEWLAKEFLIESHNRNI